MRQALSRRGGSRGSLKGRAPSQLRSWCPCAALEMVVPGTSSLALRGLCGATLTYMLLWDLRSYLAWDSELRAAVGPKFKW